MFWLKNESLEASRIWNVGKDLGFSCLGSDKIILDRLKCLEETNNMKEVLNRGGLNVLYDETD